MDLMKMLEERAYKCYCNDLDVECDCSGCPLGDNHGYRADLCQLLYEAYKAKNVVDEYHNV